ncbi:hypothetical protein ACJZ2D_016476 [Fusarium nematophilum]
MNSDTDTSAPHRRATRRTSQACNRCRASKTRCDNKIPACSACVAKNVECLRDDRRQRPTKGSPSRGPSLEQRLIQLEALLQNPARWEGKTTGTADTQPKASEITKLPGASSKDSSALGHGSAERTVSTETPSGHIQNEPQPPHDHSQADRDQQAPESMSILGVTDDYMENLRKTISNKASPEKPSIRMVTKAQLAALIQCFLNDINTLMPLFERSSLLELCAGKLPQNGDDCDHAWWASLNALIAMTLQVRAVDGDFKSIAEFSWGYFRNAFSVYPSLMMKEPKVSSVQALLLMAMFMSGSTDAQTMKLLLSSAVRMIQIIRLQRSTPVVAAGFGNDETRRIFWVAFLLDTVATYSELPSILFEDDLDIHLQHEFPNPTGNMLIFKLRIEVAIIESQVRKCLSLQSASGASPLTLRELLTLRAKMETWLHKTPSDIRPRCNAVGAPMPSDLGIIMLHCAYYRCAGMVARALESSIYSSPVNTISMPLTLPTLNSVEAARATLRLLQAMRSLCYIDLWRLLPFSLSATITLLAHTLEFPKNANDVSLIGSVTKFIRQRQQDGCDLGHFPILCVMLEQVAQVRWKQANPPLQTLPESIAGTLAEEFLQRFIASLKNQDPMQLSQGLMGNVPAPKAEAFKVFSVILGDWAKDPDGKFSIGPTPLNPSTYGFRVT